MRQAAEIRCANPGDHGLLCAAEFPFSNKFPALVQVSRTAQKAGSGHFGSLLAMSVAGVASPLVFATT